MKKRNLTFWLICILPLATSIVVLQRVADIPDFLRGTLTGVCIGLLILCVLSRKKAPLQEK
jgi:hypothetical protein